MFNFFKYMAYSFLTLILNIGIQSITLNITGRSTEAVILAIVVATVVSFVVKFFIDKNIIFKTKKGHQNERRKQVLLYAVFSIGTTLIYILVEMIFHFSFDSADLYEKKEEIGAIIGLLMGYSIKYIVDMKITFKEKI